MTFLNSETLIVALSWIAVILMWIGYAKMYRKYILKALRSEKVEFIEGRFMDKKRNCPLILNNSN